MNTIIINGSARKNGYTNTMIDTFKENIVGDVYEVDAYKFDNISPCLDCRFCWKEKACAIKDNMSEIYDKLENADVVVLASPMYFHTVTGKMKIILDRLQVYWAGFVRGDRDTYSNKTSVILMCGGAPSFDNQFLGGELVLKGVSGDINATLKGVVTASNTDKITNEEVKVMKDKIIKISSEIYGN